ncbi:MAG: amidohydrolase [Pirellulales bacterium]|nr:amidohydrolase [Pirellulales bacterium]
MIPSLNFIETGFCLSYIWLFVRVLRGGKAWAKRPNLLWASVLLSANMSVCPISRAQQPEPNVAEVGTPSLIVEGRVWTGNSRSPWAEGVALRADRVIAVGTKQQLQPLRGSSTRVIDAGAGLVVPGLFDSHIHLVDGGLRLASVQLRDARTREDFIRRIAEFAKNRRPGEWITGGDWDHTLWGGELPSRVWIDEVTPNNPVWVHRLDGHMALANSAAIRAAKLSDDALAVAGGEMVRDEAGRLTGILKDNAMSLVERVQPEPTLQQRLDATVAAMDFLAARGVTAVHHMGSWSHVEVFRMAERRGLLKTRIYACTPLEQWQRLAEEVRQRGPGTDWLRIGGLKGFVDGSLGSHTAAMLDPFTDTPSERGLFVNSAEDLEKWTMGADLAKLQVAVHAIGDRAIRAQLDIFDRVAQANGPRDRRFRIEHAQHIAPIDLPRFARLGVIPSMQPYHAIDDGRWADRVIGPKRSKTTYAFRSLLESGARPAFGSDWFVAPPTPVEGLYAAVTRRTIDGEHPQGWVPDEKIGVEQALRAYTLDAAYAGFQESQLGSLEPGKLADLVVLDRDPFKVPPENLNLITVRTTIVGGEVVFEKPDSE